MFDLALKSVLITGARRGSGRAVTVCMMVSFRAELPNFLYLLKAPCDDPHGT
jgi:hypothetical protein